MLCSSLLQPHASSVYSLPNPASDLGSLLLFEHISQASSWGSGAFLPCVWNVPPRNIPVVYSLTTSGLGTSVFLLDSPDLISTPHFSLSALHSDVHIEFVHQFFSPDIQVSEAGVFVLLMAVA